MDEVESEVVKYLVI